MTKKHFIALADAIREHNNLAVKYDGAKPFDSHHIAKLGDFCYSQNSAFNRSRWEGYIAGTNGKNGGKVKPQTNENALEG